MMSSPRVLFAILLLSAVFLGGCVNQEKEIARYREVLDDSTSQMPMPPTDAAVSLRNSLRLANQHNERLPIEGENYLQALIEKDRAFAGFLPRITLSPSYSILDAPALPTQSILNKGVQNGISGSANSLVASATRSAVLSALGQPVPSPAISASGIPGSLGSSSNLNNITSYHLSGGTLRSTQVPVVGSINLFNGFRDVENVKRSEAFIAQRAALLLDLQEVVLLEVAQSYYQVLRSERQTGVLANSLKVQDERVRDIQSRLKAGLARPLDVSQTQAQAAATRVALIQSESDVRNGRTTLAFMIGATEVDGTLTDEFDVPETSPELTHYMEEALQYRHDLAAAEDAVRVAKKNVDIAIGEYFPSVSFNVSAFLYEDNFRDASRWNSIFSANLPIFSAGLIEADVRAAWSQLRQALLSESFLRRQVNEEVKIAYENQETSRQRLKELAVQVRAATEGFKQADQSYNVGLATNLERLTAQDQMLAAQLQMASEEYNQKVFYLDLLRVVGVLREQVLDMPTTQPASTEPAESAVSS